jgi:hypothetical protein
MPFVTIRSSFAARTRFRGRSATHEAACRGHREGSTGVQSGNENVSCRRGQPAIEGNMCKMVVCVSELPRTRMSKTPRCGDDAVT